MESSTSCIVVLVVLVLLAFGDVLASGNGQWHFQTPSARIKISRVMVQKGGVGIFSISWVGQTARWTTAMWVFGLLFVWPWSFMLLWFVESLATQFLDGPNIKHVPFKGKVGLGNLKVQHVYTNGLPPNMLVMLDPSSSKWNSPKHLLTMKAMQITSLRHSKKTVGLCTVCVSPIGSPLLQHGDPHFNCSKLQDNRPKA